MFQLDDLMKLDPTRIDLTRLDLRKLEMPKFDMPKFDMPKFELPTFELPQLPKVDVPFELPSMELPSLPLDRLAGLARDAAYVGVGAAVVTVKAADERRRALSDQVTTQVRKLVDSIA